jgi:SAM-dependent methyltransferase
MGNRSPIAWIEMTVETTYSLNLQGIHVPNRPASHRDDEYEEAGFDILKDMQSRHFWYQGRHRFLLRALDAEMRHVPQGFGSLNVIDLGGGCGGWISYLRTHGKYDFGELALADSSLRALEFAGNAIRGSVNRYQIDLLNLEWENRWDVVFLLDVLEHLPPDTEALKQIGRALRPGGILFVTTPALKFFWSYNDDLAHHVRRYSRRDFIRLAAESGLLLKSSRYFMFFLSPILWLSRLAHPNVKQIDPAASQLLLKKTHRVPAAPLNALLKLIFALETPLGLKVPFPWGTSILGVFQKPA